MKVFDFLGVRTIKTGVAIFLTALICQLLGLPPVFAVITAIVTLEPTVSDSIKKGLVRFPASAIGSAYAVLFIALFGNSPITYTLAAVFTIITSYKLKLHAGLLVATITAVAMIEVVYDNYFLSFLTRLGTTSIGLIVSTVVNMFILPPNYIKEINDNINKLYKNIGEVIQSIVVFNNEMIHETDVDIKIYEISIKQLMQTFWLNNNVMKHESSDGHLPNELILLYELSALIQLASEFDLVKNSIKNKEKAVQNQNI